MEALLDRKQAAAVLGIKPDTLAQWTWLGKGPKSVKVGGLVKYRTADLEAWLDERTRTSSNPVREAELRATEVAAQPAPAPIKNAAPSAAV